MDTSTAEILTGCGERPDLTQALQWDVWGSMEIETGIFIGEVILNFVIFILFINIYNDYAICLTYTRIHLFIISESGSSSNKCSDTYMGPEPMSEIEFRNIRDYVLALEPKPILAHALHSYSQLWLYPYGYDYDALPENWKEIVSTRQTNST